MSVFAFEGIDCCGKSSAIENVYKKLKKFNIDVKVLSFTNGPEIRKMLREGASNEDLAIQLVCEFNERNPESILNRFDVILVDRGLMSFDVYQRALLPADKFESISKSLKRFSCHNFVFDTPVSVAMKRMATREMDMIESKGIDFHSRVYDMYKEISSSGAYQCTVLDGTLSQEAISDTISDTILKSF